MRPSCSQFKACNESDLKRQRAIAALLADRAGGVFQLSGPRDVTYGEAARFLAGQLGADPALVKETSALATGQPLGSTPRHTTLDSTLLRERYGVSVPDVWDVIGTTLRTVIRR